MFHLLRLFKILNTFARYRVTRALPPMPGLLLVNLLFWFLPGRWFAKRIDNPEQALRLALQELGPVFIKMGQMLSTRRDILEDDLANDLANLQDNIPPFDSQTARNIIETEFGRSIPELFATFDDNPLASASIAQVHTATLKTGEEVVVKVLRPGLEKIISRDVGLMRLGAKWMQKLLPITERFFPDQVVSDYENTILAELDLNREAANQQRFRNNFKNSNLLYVPKVYWDLVGSSVLVMERIYGVPIDQIDELKRRNVNLEKLSERGVKIFFMQVFRDNFFHADMHPGNVMVSTADPENPVYISLDNAIVGSLDRREQFLLGRQLMAFLDQDYEQMAKLLVEAGWVPEDTRVTEFEIALRAICEPIFDKPLDELEFGPVLVSLLRTARQFKIRALPQFVLLEKTLLHIEGLGRTINPKLDIWGIGRPLLTHWVRDQVGPDAIMREIKRNVPAWMEQAPQVPQLAFDALVSMADMKSQQNQIIQRLEQQNQLLARAEKRNRYWLLGVILVTLAAVSEGVLASSWSFSDFSLGNSVLVIAGGLAIVTGWLTGRPSS